MQNADSIFRSLQEGSLGEHALIDVRSPGEFAEGHFPGFTNLPVLNNEERAIVGLTYKEKGQKVAIETGHELVNPNREFRIESWKKAIETSNSKSGIVTCWRGGLRSKISTQWLEESGMVVERIEGGYKMLRRRALEILENHPYRFLVVSGLTGSGKTKLLESVGVSKVDLEALAHHRGSAFGHDLFKAQPAQATFENTLACALIDESKTYLVEDESRKIGQLHLPGRLKQSIMKSPVVVLESTLGERVQLIFEGYVRDPIIRGKHPELVRDHFSRNLTRIQKPLGSAMFSKIHKALETAFQNPELQISAHEEWITMLLREHYDKRYLHAFERLERPVVFRGNLAECQLFIKSKLLKSSSDQSDRIQ